MRAERLPEPEGEPQEIVREDLLVAIAEIEEQRPATNQDPAAGAKCRCGPTGELERDWYRGIRQRAESITVNVQTRDPGGCPASPTICTAGTMPRTKDTQASCA